MSVRICSDVGGTFTDTVVMDAESGASVFKTLSTPRDPVEGVLAGLRLAADSRGESLAALLASCEFFSHGSTIGTNAVLEGKTARIGLICTKGHRDILLWREGGKANPFDWDLDYPEPFVPRRLTFAVAERISPEGNVLVPLDDAEVRGVIRSLRAAEVEAIAVALLWSFVNPEHELRIGELIRDQAPAVGFSLSHQVNPVIREYRRTVGTCLDAALKPLVGGYIDRLRNRLREEGFAGEPYLLTSSGGITSPDEIIARPVYSIDSGPSVAPVAGRFFARSDLGQDNIITCDMGGTSFDVSRVTGGEITVTLDWRLGSEQLSIPRVDVRSIGAGGGSIAWVDSGGLIRVGPESTGSEPGPACYGRGGELATVTDAALVLGYYDPEYFVGGAMPLHTERAREAIVQHVAEPLDLNLEDAAFTIWNTACVNMSEAIREITVLEGIDPRDYVMVAGGGAAGAHIVPIAAGVGVRRLILPRVAGVLSAFGGAMADVVREFHRTWLTSTSDFDAVSVNDVLADLNTQAQSFFEELCVPHARRQLQYAAEARYPFQERELTVPLRKDAFADAADVDRFVDDFHAAHDARRGSFEPGQDVEVTLWKLRAVGLSGREATASHSGSGNRGRHQCPSHRRAHFADLGGMTDTPVYDGDRLNEGQTVAGPALIEEATTTLVLPPGSLATVTASGGYLVVIDAPSPQKQDGSAARQEVGMR